MADDPLAATVTATVTFAEAASAAVSAAVAYEVRELQVAATLISHACAGSQTPADRRGRLAFGCLELAVEYATGIAVLAGQACWAPAFALQRVLLESYVRGAWLVRCASEEQLGRFEQGILAERNELAELLADVERAHGQVCAVRTRLKLGAWDSYRDFAEAGFQHVVRRNSKGSSGANYPDAELIHLLRSSGALGLLAATELTAIAGHRDVSKMLKERTEQFAATLPT